MSMIPTLVSSSNPADVFTHASKWDLRNVVTYGQGYVKFMLVSQQSESTSTWSFDLYSLNSPRNINNSLATRERKNVSAHSSRCVLGSSLKDLRV